MTKQIQLYLAILLLLGLVSACSQDEGDPEPRKVELTPIDQYTSIDKVSGTIYIKDLPGSLGNTHASGHTPVFFDLETHQIINPYEDENTLLELPEEQQKSKAWDLGFTGVYNSLLAINKGTDSRSPGYGGQGQGAILVMDAQFDEVDEAPSEETFEAFMQVQATSGWENYPPGHKGWFFYSLESHIMRPVSGITILLRTPDGKYAKVEMTSIYLGNPEKPTINSPAPYFTFRYFLQEDGSRNLKTR
ncbi:HmuY family protein [Rapidithrix thailandica]|uniref:HmuY family protein n=1 Tax=Rapidithrix thailandica TaxID=413964 RepID=A0AAW9RXN2_9BACT